MEIPADGIVIEAADLTTDEAAMTGEPGKFNIKINIQFKIENFLKIQSNKVL
jgi:hypothetical protein